MIIYTIGSSKKNLREFVTKLLDAGIKKVIDVRLNNTSQLAGYAKKENLEYVLGLVGLEYEHHPELAPTEELLRSYKQKEISWDEYEKLFNQLLVKRHPIDSISLDSGDDPICLLCSEDKATRCHRRLLAEYYQRNVPGVEIHHL